MTKFLKNAWNLLIYISVIYLFANGIYEFLEILWKNDSEENDN